MTPAPRTLARAALLLALAGFASASLAAAQPAETLARMDKAAAGFRGLTANLHRVSYTSVIKESSEESGHITLLRVKPRDLRMLVEFTKPEARAVAFQGRKLQVYFPKIQTVQEYDLGKQSALIDQFLLLGFGTPVAELKKSYDFKYTGEDTVNGVKADRLELTPKSAEAQNYVRRIEIWIAQSDGTTIQQKVHQPSRNYDLFTYSDIKLNPSMSEEAVRLKLPKGVKKETPQR